MSTTVLVVEDDLEINELLGEYLALESIQYVQATTGEAGLAQASAARPDAVILDLMLPDVDGYEVARTLSTQRATFDIPVVILSCMNQAADREKGYECGALHYMNKPFLPDDLLATLRLALAWRKGLKSRVGAGSILLGGAGPGAGDELCTRARSLHELTSDLFLRTELPDATVAGMRAAVELMGQWADRWSQEHGGKGQTRVEYRVDGESGAGKPRVEWVLSDVGDPGLLGEVFFKPAPAGSSGGGILGWGVGALKGKFVVLGPAGALADPPSPWMELLPKLGAQSYERDPKARTVRIVSGRLDGAAQPVEAVAIAKGE